MPLSAVNPSRPRSPWWRHPLPLLGFAALWVVLFVSANLALQRAPKTPVVRLVPASTTPVAAIAVVPADPPHRRPPVSTLVVLGIFALLLWVNAAVNRYRFNLVVAIVGSVPVLLVLLWTVTRPSRPAADH